ncbi:hypothetical protein BDW67DRAFT_26223 [Aspergillus spinulosporus]
MDFPPPPILIGDQGVIDQMRTCYCITKQSDYICSYEHSGGMSRTGPSGARSIIRSLCHYTAWLLRFCALSSQQRNHLTAPSTQCRSKMLILSPSSSEAIDTCVSIQKHSDDLRMSHKCRSSERMPQSTALEQQMDINCLLLSCTNHMMERKNIPMTPVSNIVIKSQCRLQTPLLPYCSTAQPVG